MSRKKIYDEIAKSKTSGGGNSIRDGVYLLSVKSFKLDEKYSGLIAITEFEVIESAPMEQDVDPNPVGSSCDWVLNLSGGKGGAKAASAAKSNLKALVLALGGFAEGDVTDEEVAEMVEDFAENGAMVGMKIRDETYRKTIQSGAREGQQMTCHKWIHVPQTKEEIEAEKARLNNA